MQKDEWLTPPEILKALGRFELDLCAPSCIVIYRESNIKSVIESGIEGHLVRQKNEKEAVDGQADR
jgi:hypothetical protein